MKTEAQKWGETAIAFIGSATATAIFAVLGYFLHPIQWLFVSCCVLAAITLLIFAIMSISILRWWIVIARRNSERKRSS